MAALIGLAVTAGLAAWAVLAPREEAGPQAPESVPAPEDASVLRYAAEYPAIGYSATEPSDPVARLRERLVRGELGLTFDGERGYLDSLLGALGIDTASQLLVFSKTSVQVRDILPETPRAIFFDDATYVAWVRGAPTIEIAAMDPNVGPVFYTLEQRGAADAPFERQFGRCLRCHDSYSLTGGGVPRFILGSGYIGADGNLVSHEGWILTSERTPLRSRWGGWYVTGHHGDQVHLGNLIVRDVATLQDLDTLRVGNIGDLDALIDTNPYPTRYSDIVALLVIEHQVGVQNLITRVNYDTRTAFHADEGQDTAETGSLVASTAEPLVRALLFADAVDLTSPITGTSGFAEQFEARALRDSAGRSLRDLDLTRRVFRYPLSYLIHSEAFDALPDATRAHVYRRIVEILAGDDASGDFAHLSQADRSAVLEILAETKSEFAAVLAGTPGDQG